MRDEMRDSERRENKLIKNYIIVLQYHHIFGMRLKHNCKFFGFTSSSNWWFWGL